MESTRAYIAIDLKSFYASVECVARGLDPLTTNLVVADLERTEKTICLAVSPSLKAWGISGRARLFEVVQRVKEINAGRQYRAPGGVLTGSSCQDDQLRANPSLAVDYIVAPPRMALYREVSTKIHAVYLRTIAPEDIFVYSIDEVFLDVTAYLDLYGLSAHDLARKMIREVLAETGITATAGIGSNLYLCKVAMDVVAKHVPADVDGVRIAQLDESSYRRSLWTHRPLTDFWRVGKGYTAKLEKYGIYTMGDIALLSTFRQGEDLLYREFGVNAELLIDHAWGWEPCTLADIRSYRPESRSIQSGQVLKTPYEYEKARLIVQEMADALALELLDKRLLTTQIVLTIGYDIENLTDEGRRRRYSGEITTDRYGRKIPKHAHGTGNLECPTSSSRSMIEAVLSLFDRIINRDLLVRRITITASQLSEESNFCTEPQEEQMNLFTDYQMREESRAAREQEQRKERALQKAALDIQKKFGKNALFRASSLQEGATALERGRQIGGHKA